MASVILKDLTKTFDGENKVVNQINLTVNDGEFMVLVGPSGCGKSTTLRMIAGLEEVSSGEIIIGDRVVNNIAPKDRDIAMVFQNYALYPHMTVYENMAFGLKLRKFPGEEIKTRVHEASDILGLTDLLKRRPKALSGGQRQRVAVGRAIVRKPRVFLFDEPLSNLDAKLRVQMRIEISKLHQRLATTMIYVTHDQVEAMTMGDRITVMKDGLIHQVAAPLDLYAQPANTFVGGFIGSPAMNFFPGELHNNGKLQFKSPGFEFTLPDLFKTSLAPAGDKGLILGIRPEHFTLKADQSQTQVSLSAEIDVIEPMGNELIIYLKKDQLTFVMRTDASAVVKVGDIIKLFVNLQKIHFFESRTTSAIKPQPA